MMKVLLGVCGGGYNERFLEKNFKRQLPNKVHAVLGVGVFISFCLSLSYLIDIN